MKDLSSKITVFLLSTGNINYKQCLESIKKQTVKFNLIEIKNIFPLKKALNEMLKKCYTEYLIEIDEDMVLDNDAIETLYNNIYNRYDFVEFPIWDTYLDFPIYGIKIFKKTALNKIAFSDSLSEDFTSEQKIRKKYYVPLIKEFCLGEHSPVWEPYEIFQRYYVISEKTRLKNWTATWIRSIPQKVFNNFINDPSELNFMALLGLAGGTMSGNKHFTISRNKISYVKNEYSKARELLRSIKSKKHIS